MKCQLHPLTKAIIGLGYILLICFIASQYFASREGPRSYFVQEQMHSIESAIDAYHLNTGQYLKTFDDLLICPVGLEDKWAGPYLKEKQLLDPWGNRYIYEPNQSDTSIYRLISYGANGKPGGKGENADQEHFTPIQQIKSHFGRD